MHVFNKINAPFFHEFILGRELAFELAKREAKVVLGCRNLNKANEAIRWIQNRIENEETTKKKQPADLTALHLDLSSLISVERFADEFADKFQNLHILVNNAGIMGGPFSTTPGGVETSFGVNHLGHFHLTNLLKEKLENSAPSRIIIISSGYYKKWKSADFSKVTSSDGYLPLQAYARSKLANCLHAVALKNKVNSAKIGVYVVRPGFVRGTQLGRHFPRLQTILFYPMIWFMSKNLHQGVQTMLHCCLSDDLKSGAIYDNCMEEAYVEKLVNEENAQLLWSLSEELVKNSLEIEKKIE